MGPFNYLFICFFLFGYILLAFIVIVPLFNSDRTCFCAADKPDAKGYPRGAREVCGRADQPARGGPERARSPGETRRAPQEGPAGESASKTQ